MFGMKRQRDVLERIAKALEQRCHSKGTILVNLIVQRSGPMSVPEVLPPQNAFSNQKQPVNTIPTKPNGDPDPDAVVSCVSSDPGQVGVEVNPAGGFFITTPLDSGSAVITLSAPGYQSAQFQFTYNPPAEGKLNVFFGEDVPDA